MNEYICKKCLKPQYSACEYKGREPCIYCGAPIKLVYEGEEKLSEMKLTKE